ncbi:copper-binding protein [Paraburkholderia sp. BCC1884]|uniref:copper-binding protein n=1 Tax=Paraburkholderia sp. BCC1884 TaxID=2562668 RepID=UPI001181F878|nr:copper-binding protein [Paraburkholderia sp. BCC1884]
MNTIAAAFTVMLGFAVAVPASAQEASQAQAQQVVGGGVFLHVQAHVIKIDADTNTVTLRGPRGNVAVMEVDPDVADVKKLRVGDTVDIAYKNAILISADKVASKGIRERVETEVTHPASGGVVSTARRVEVIATVQKIDRKHRKVTLRGPSRTETFDVVPDVSLTNLKVGDSVKAVFIAAAAASVLRNGDEVK